MKNKLLSKKHYFLDIGKMGIEVLLNKIIALTGISIGIKELANNIKNCSFKSALLLAIKTLLVNFL